jgi:hypothetical protein
MVREPSVYLAHGVQVMKCARVLLCALLFGLAGCAGDGDKDQWKEFWKDVRGDNMKMRNDVLGK